MSALDITGKDNAGSARSLAGVGDPPLLGRKAVLMGMLASGCVLANAAPAVAAGTVKPIASAQPAYAPKWAPSTAYVRGQQVISPNNDVVSATVAHMSSAAYATDTAKWTLSSTFATVVSHGAIAATARPAAASVTWIGTVEPTNMTEADLWIGPM